MKYVDNAHIDKEDLLEIFFDKDGQVSTERKENKYAKIVGKEGKEAYYIRTHLNVPYDPLGPYGHRESYLETKLTKVSRDTFDFYAMYLKTNNSIYLTRASRGFLND